MVTPVIVLASASCMSCGFSARPSSCCLSGFLRRFKFYFFFPLAADKPASPAGDESSAPQAPVPERWCGGAPPELIPFLSAGAPPAWPTRGLPVFHFHLPPPWALAIFLLKKTYSGSASGAAFLALLLDPVESALSLDGPFRFPVPRSLTCVRRIQTWTDPVRRAQQRTSHGQPRTTALQRRMGTGAELGAKAAQATVTVWVTTVGRVAA